METLIFDIGKTNKKAFVFDEHLDVVHTEQKVFSEVKDEDGFPTDDLYAIEKWIKSITDSLITDEKRNIRKINFSTYGASFVHLDKEGRLVGSFYNYLKKIPAECLDQFYENYGDPNKIALSTSSPPLGMLNSGLQIMWLKRTKPDIFKQINWSLHLPQYWTYSFTGIPVSEYTSIGCHTSLWDLEKRDYHSWVSSENICHVFPQIVSSDQTYKINYLNEDLEIGVGIHDSSAALLPYLTQASNAFLLISTGTWSISLNPFNHELLTVQELENDCLHYLQVDGKPVKAARLFLGQEYQEQLAELIKNYNSSEIEINNINYNRVCFNRNLNKHLFSFKHLSPIMEACSGTVYQHFSNKEEAYHRLMFELVQLQVASSRLAIGGSQIKHVFIDGGFANNAIYVEMLKEEFKGILITQMDNSNGSALGAAMVINQKLK